jgi:hypothetical protein
MCNGKSHDIDCIERYYVRRLLAYMALGTTYALFDYVFTMPNAKFMASGRRV